MLATRITSIRRAPVFVARLARPYSDGEGSVARSKEFSKKEKAHEDQFVKQHEQAQLKKLRAEINAKKAELEALEKKQSEASGKSN
ncbi:hypothetical protein M0805_008060 [Coniferiporia weirii]|nr:hypothetical protein M0805_008060 [Coniferiporia weirii]